MSAFVSTTTGSAPLSNASTNSRSSRRCDGRAVRECSSAATSTLAPTMWPALAPRAARRTNALRRSRTEATRSPLGVATAQSPTATSMPIVRNRSSPASVQTVAQPRSRRATRPIGPGDPSSRHCSAQLSSQPRLSRLRITPRT